ncbi:MAG: DUF86 domain-containing protein [Planctomycetes bacterium]|nr:DUF86 domain-containing protein [Planctomycetota bacterium]
MDRRLLIERKIALVRENLARLGDLAKLDRQTFVSDFTKIDSAEHRLQTSIQALIDLGAIVAADRGIPPRSRSTELVEALHDAGVFPADRRDTYVKMTRFRNVLVHRYNHVDVDRVYEVLKTHRRDIETFLDDLVRALAPGP